MSTTSQRWISIVRHVIKRHQLSYSILSVVAIIMVWRGTWHLLDRFLFPQNELWSDIISVALGLFLLFIDDFKLEELQHGPGLDPKESKL